MDDGFFTFGAFGYGVSPFAGHVGDPFASRWAPSPRTPLVWTERTQSPSLWTDRGSSPSPWTER